MTITKEEVIKELEKTKQFKSHIMFKGKVFSIDELISEVERETDVGKAFVEMMQKYG